MTARLLLLSTLLGAIAGLSGSAIAAPPQISGVDIDEAWSDVTFANPVAVAHAKDGSGAVYVVERAGRIYRMPKYAGEAKPAKKELFLDISSTIQGIRNAQGGLLALAFHPRYAENRRFFVTLTRDAPASERTSDPDNKFMLVVEEYRSDGQKGIPGSAKPLLAVRKKTALHQAGDIAFGPRGRLFIAVGDDAEPHTSGARHKSQDLRSPLGKILRIDVDAPPAGGKRYAIPTDNPWPSSARQVLPELWAYGLRNPWRISFDAQGRLWTTEPGTSHKVDDVPGNTQEWVTQIVRAGNHGWPFFEGNRRLSTPPPNLQRLVPKTFAYEREGEGSTAGIGGYVYRGKRIPALKGKYVFGDFGRGQVYAIDLSGANGAIRGSNWQLVTDLPNISAFGEDEDGELYVCLHEDEGWIAVLTPGS